MRVAIVVGETSGDILGAGLIAAIKKLHPHATFEGIAGPLMEQQGAQSLYPMERLAVMGIVEILGRYRELSAIRKNLIKYFSDNPPDVFIGVDAPEFNIHLAYMLKKVGIKTVQYVSPQVWAWRQYRVKKIAKSLDLILTLFPFEEEFYASRSIAVKFVGHPLANDIPMRADKIEARKKLELPENKSIVALLPGSRGVEVNNLAEIFLQAANWCVKRKPDLYFVTPLASQARRNQFEHFINKQKDNLAIKLVDGRSRDVLAACDVVLLASGTATLEAMLHKKPMVVAYRLSLVSTWIFKLFAKVSQYALPNLLAGKTLVPELMQENATPEKIGAAILHFLDNPDEVAILENEFDIIHRQLNQDANTLAAQAVSELVNEH